MSVEELAKDLAARVLTKVPLAGMFAESVALKLVSMAESGAWHVTKTRKMPNHTELGPRRKSYRMIVLEELLLGLIIVEPANLTTIEVF